MQLRDYRRILFKNSVVAFLDQLAPAEHEGFAPETLPICGASGADGGTEADRRAVRTGGQCRQAVLAGRRTETGMCAGQAGARKMAQGRHAGGAGGQAHRKGHVGGACRAHGRGRRAGGQGVQKRTGLQGQTCEGRYVCDRRQSRRPFAPPFAPPFAQSICAAHLQR